jgi:hypothetical protein
MDGKWLIPNSALTGANDNVLSMTFAKQCFLCVPYIGVESRLMFILWGLRNNDPSQYISRTAKIFNIYVFFLYKSYQLIGFIRKYSNPT